MSYDNKAIVRSAYHTAEGDVLDLPGWTGSFIQRHANWKRNFL